jgi:hypothetical protein
MVDSVSSSTSSQPLTADEMIARAQKAVETQNANGAQSAVQKLLAEHGDADADTVELSPVAKLLAAKSAQAEQTSTPYTEQDWYLTAKVNQLRGQLETFSTIPGLDPSGSVIDSIGKEINDIIAKQQAKLKKTQDDAAAKQAELAKQQANAYQGVSSTDMITNAKNAAAGIKTEAPISAEAQALLDKIQKGGTVDTTA